MDKLERARELFHRLECRGVGERHAAEIARRTFLIEDSLSAIKG
jgi:hypothetical protein